MNILLLMKYRIYYSHWDCWFFFSRKCIFSRRYAVEELIKLLFVWHILLCFFLKENVEYDFKIRIMLVFEFFIRL